MPGTTNDPRTALREYADALLANAQVADEGERDEIADDLIEIVGNLERQGKEVAQLIYELLAQSTQNESENLHR